MSDEELKAHRVEQLENHEPAAYLFPGAAIYFDADGQQMPELQTEGLCGLHEYVKTYPKAKVYWAIWKQYRKQIDPALVSYLLEQISKKRTKPE